METTTKTDLIKNIEELKKINIALEETNFIFKITEDYINLNFTEENNIVFCAYIDLKNNRCIHFTENKTESMYINDFMKWLNIYINTFYLF